MAEHASVAPAPPVRFDTHPSRYTHLKLTFDGPVARLTLAVVEDRPLRPGYTLKQNSYDLGVDIELADAVQRLRFEHPETTVVIVDSNDPKVFCAGANIYMLGASTHGFKVNFCKFTNETRIYLEEACAESGQHYLAALNGTAAGGGYELALACETIVLCDDGSSAVSFPETPLLAVLPGTGGLTRLVDKRRVRRDLADVFCTLAEGVRGKRAKEWGLVDEVASKSKFSEAVAARVKGFVDGAPAKTGAGMELRPLDDNRWEEGSKVGTDHRYVSVVVDRATRVADVAMLAPDAPPPGSAAALRSEGCDTWFVRAFREFDAVLLDLRFNHPEVGLIVLKTRGDAALVREHDEAMLALVGAGDWLAKEIVLHARRVLRRLDLSAKSIFAIVDPGSAFAGSMFELLLAADRAYMFDGGGGDLGAYVAMSPMNFGPLRTSSGITRLETRFLRDDAKVESLRTEKEFLDAPKAMKLGLVTFTPDEIDWEDEVRLAIEERASLSPDALTGMEASLRFPGPETLDTKIFARLSAWQNWIFQRPNAVGERGALTMYGRPERPEFDWRRT